MSGLSGSTLLGLNKYRNWVSRLAPNTCPDCKSLHGKIYTVYESVKPKPPLHPNCKCIIAKLKALKAGTATNNSTDGADWWLKYFKKLPEYYITEEEMELLGWRKGQKPSKYIIGKMLTKGIYENKNGQLPQAEGHEWYEADLNYQTGKRNKARVLWSNDGLIFVTYDHYLTFNEIV